MSLKHPVVTGKALVFCTETATLLPLTKTIKRIDFLRKKIPIFLNKISLEDTDEDSGVWQDVGAALSQASNDVRPCCYKYRLWHKNQNYK